MIRGKDVVKIQAQLPVDRPVQAVERDDTL
jgi:hypothetical protein